MKANELRIGNWFQIKDQDVKTYAQIEGIGNLQMAMGQLWSIDELLPIPLTKEWLDRFNMFNGKEYAYGNYSLRRGNYATSEILDHGWSIGIYNSEGWMFLVCVKYVHQLQNVIFALTAGDVLTEK